MTPMTPMIHSVLSPENAALITGGASGIGFAAARRCVESGMRVCIVDRNEAALKEAGDTLSRLAGDKARNVIAIAADVADRNALETIADMIFGLWGTVHLLMNNAGIQPGSAIFGPREAWDAVLSVNLGSVVHGCQVFVPKMIERGAPGLVVNTGSKQGITTPPGDPAYNVSKAGVKVFTEALQHELRNTADCTVTAHLLIPGFVFTPLTAKGRTEQPAGAWTPEETVDFMLERLRAGDFYILCPDGEVTREMDVKRILWAAGDLAENRQPLSRWHTDYKEGFQTFLKTAG